MNLRRRVGELALLQEQIKGEETILNKAIETNQIPGDIKKLHITIFLHLFLYSKRKINESV